MKKLILTFVLVLGFTSAIKAQVEGNAIGLRFGYGAEISYQHLLDASNRLEFDLGYNSFGTNARGFLSWGSSISGLYHWVNPLNSVAEGLNWYVGPGAALLIHSGFFGVGVLGQIGIEYKFQIPLQLSLDYRPGIYIIPGTDRIIRGSGTGFCFAVRYVL